jgi:hypothetical protein
MLIRQAGISLLLVIMMTWAGCSSIHSRAVRELIKTERVKVDEAQRNIDLFHKETEERIKILNKALSDVNERYRILQQSEAKHAFIFSSYQNIMTKRQHDAHSAVYLLGKLYLMEYEGLEKTVRDQFDEDLCAIRDAANLLSQSWKNLGTLHAQIDRYAQKTVFASVDPDFTAAILEQTPGTSERLSNVLTHSRTVNDALQEIVGARIIRGRALERTLALSSDLQSLIERIKKD